MHYFYGTAAAPFTRAHEAIVRSILEKDETNRVYVAVTDHGYKEVSLPWVLRAKTAEVNLEDCIEAGRVLLLKQDERTYAFLSKLHDWMDVIVVGEDEWLSLQAGEWHYSDELLSSWQWKVFPRRDGVSSSEVRKLLASGASYEQVKHLITEKTWDVLQPSLHLLQHK